ncbi:WD_0033/WD_0034 family tandem repeat-containing protein [Wolbachia endosymbiont of Bemisia tabaci]|uniref:WD_0033/WD_0034 family tandem repeat-containing protein n=1 Tax=Wolbachia endosymbiont of Bemisia tabaci TaxID=215173 RepID=UPI0015D099EC|nr:hypothetical protein [Wolbachia endosymbiont of Bemisia tabaci]
MLNYLNLTQEQRNLYLQLKKAISNRRSISNILETVSENDLLTVLTAGYTTRFPRGGKQTLTLLSLAIYKDNNESVDFILTHSNKGILQEILKISSSIHYTTSSHTYTLTPLAFAIHRSNNECINSILMKAQDSGILQNILTYKDIMQFSVLTYIFTPLGFAIYKVNNECINSILMKAQGSGILQNILTAVSTMLFPYGWYTFNASELNEIIHHNNASIRTILDDVSIFPRLLENSRT